MPVIETKMSSLNRAVLFCAGIAAVFLILVLPSPASAATEPFKIEFDQSNIQMGLLGSLPLDSVASTASLEGTIDESGNVTIPKGNFKMPVLSLDDPVKIRGFMGIEGPATGTFDRATGQLVLDAQAGIWMSLDVIAILDLVGMDINDLLGGIGGTGGINIGSLIRPMLSNLTCGFSPMDVRFTTEANSLANGARFINGPGGTGAITAEWSQLGPLADKMSLPLVGGPCNLLRSYLPTLLPTLLEGGIGGGELPIDLGDIDIAGLLSNLDNLNLGPSAITLTRTQADIPPDPPDPPDPSTGSPKLKLSVTPKNRRVRAGKNTVFRAKVKNNGTAQAKNVRVCLTGPGVGILVKWRCTKFGAIKPGASKVRGIKVRVRSRAPRRNAGFRFSLKSSNARDSATRARLRVLG